MHSCPARGAILGPRLLFYWGPGRGNWDSDIDEYLGTVSTRTVLMDDVDVAEIAARRAGAVLKLRFGKAPEGVRVKTSTRDLVSSADLEADSAIRETIRGLRPEDGLLSEESEETPGISGRRWVVDPLDGTTNFLSQYPHWCVSMLLEDQQGPLAGVVYDLLRDELFRAKRGGGCELNGDAVRVREEHSVEEALVAVNLDLEDICSPSLSRVVGQVRDLRLSGSLALDLAWVAAGRLTCATYTHGDSPWDWGAGELLVREAGGVTIELDLDVKGAVVTGSRATVGFFRRQA